VSTRRDFITLLGGAAAAWPLAARAQQPALPVVGFFSAVLRESLLPRIAAFRRGLVETGYVEGQTVTIEYRFANEQYDRLPELAADLIRRRAAVIVASGDIAAFAAKAATNNIPIVFFSGGDPVRTGLVASLNRPGGNVTGVTTFSVDLVPKRLELLHELLPNAAVIALLMDQNNADGASQLREVQEAARRLGLQLLALNARTASDIDTAFIALVQQRANALLVGAGSLMTSQRDQISALTARYAVPAIYPNLEDVEAGGLIGYGNNNPDAYSQAGVYTGRILKGAKPADLPVVQATKFELVINLKAAKALGLAVPPQLLARADEVIE
jgi:putative ABC transport system substrate-binding protein